MHVTEWRDPLPPMCDWLLHTSHGLGAFEEMDGADTESRVRMHFVIKCIALIAICRLVQTVARCVSRTLDCSALSSPAP